MRVLGCCSTVVMALACWTGTARAQLGEVQLGGLISYGMPDAYGLGAGLVAGVAAGRIVYVGLRWAYLRGGKEAAVAAPTEVTNRVQLLAADLGLLIPVNTFEVVPGASFGVARIAQRVRAPPAEPESAHAYEFYAAPSLSVHVHAAGLVWIPEVQYCFAGRPNLAWPASHRGLVTTVRVVIPVEVGRIRH